jgi:hypothetical protein
MFARARSRLPRPSEPHYFANFEVDDGDQARRLVVEKWPGEDGLFLVREDGDRLVRVPDRDSAGG